MLKGELPEKKEGRQQQQVEVDAWIDGTSQYFLDFCPYYGCQTRILSTEISRILPSFLLLKEVVLFPDPKLPQPNKKKVHNAHFPCCRCLPSWAALSSKMDIIFSQKKIHFYLTSHFSKLINMAGRDCPKMSPCLTIGCSCTIVIIHDKFSHPLNLSWSLLLAPHRTWLF